MAGDQFKKASWIYDSNIYEVNLRQYTSEGTIKAFVKHLPRLKDMGIEILWFMPLTPIAQKNKKGVLGSYYACSDYYAVNPEFGTAGDFKKLVQQAKQMGFKIIIDWVANHTGWDHKWTTENPSFYTIDLKTHDFKMPAGMEDIIELNYQNPDLQKAMIDAMLFWISEFDIDGFRCDLAFWVIPEFWMEARKELEKTKTLFWLGEYDPLDHPEYNNAFDAAYTWAWMHKTASFCKGEFDLQLLKNLLLQYDQVANSSSLPVWFTSNHDENSWNGTEYEKYGVMAQTLAVVSFTWKGLPLIYSGQEIPNYKRLPFFEKVSLDWNGVCALHEFYKALLLLRKNNRALQWEENSKNIELLQTNATNEVLAFLRKKDGYEVMVLLNFSNTTPQIKFTDWQPCAIFNEIFSGLQMDPENPVSIPIEPWGFLVFEKIRNH